MAKAVSKKSSTTTRKRRARTAASPKKAAIQKPAAAPVTPPDETAAVPHRVPSALKLFRQAVVLLWNHRALFLGISLIYALLSLILVQSSSGALNISDLHSSFKNSSDHLANGVLTLAWLLGGSDSSTQDASTGIYSTLLFILITLAIVWSLRQIALGKKIRIRDGFYNGMYPLVPVFLVVFVGLLQLIPAIIGTGLYDVMVSYGYANGWLRIVWAVPALALVFLSIYLVTATILGAYIAMLPDMTPLAALRASRQLVKGRRWLVIRKLIFLPVALLIVTGVLLIPVLLTVPLVAPWELFLVSILYVPIIHSYMYGLYRELLA